jgi:hypothetical protein
MDKQQATRHIVNRMRAGYGTPEIVDELSRILKAPTNVIGQFVDQVAAQHPEIAPPVQPVEQEDPPDWIESLSPGPEPLVDPEPRMPSTHSDLPPGLQQLIEDSEDGNSWNESNASEEVRDDPYRDLPKRAEFVPPSEKSEDPLNPLNESTNGNLEELAKEVLSQLKKRRRQNDIVEFVCHQTGWHWNKSQRFVARTQTKNHEVLQASQNRVTLFVGIGIIIVGLVMALNGVTAIADYAKLAAFARTNPSVLLNVSPQGIVFALAASVTGLGMIIGGGYGVSRAIINH